MKSKENLGVIIVGGHVQGLGIIRIYGQHGIPVVLLDDTSYNLGRFSRYCSKFFKYEKHDLLAFLIHLSKKHTTLKNWLIVPTKDYHVKVLSQNRKSLSKFYKISTDDWSSISVCYNKILTYKKAQELNILIPNTIFPASKANVVALELTYPCIIKPAIMHEFYDKFKKKVFVCHSKDELIQNYDKAIQIIPENQIIIQEIIMGTCENQYSACYLFLNNSVVSTLTARRKRQHPLDFGNATTFAEIVENPVLLNAGMKLLASIGYNGICEVEFKRSSVDDKFYFLEINPRSWKWHTIAQKGNINFLINLYNYHYEKPFVRDNEPDYSICWQHLITDIPTILKQLVKGQYKKSSCKRKQHAVFCRRDFWPGLIEIILLPILIFKR